MQQAYELLNEDPNSNLGWRIIFSVEDQSMGRRIVCETAETGQRLSDLIPSRVTNGSLLPSITDGRSAWVRRCKDVISAHLADLGGEDATSAAERSLVRRAAVLTT